MEVFKAGDWVKIKYGEYEGRLAKIAIHKKSGEYGVILYENNLGMHTEQTASAAIIMLSANALIPLPPYVLSIRQLKSLLSGETAYEDLAEKVYPSFNLKLERRYTLMASDIRKALININKKKDPLPHFKEWFWIILNVFYEDLGIPGKYDPDLFSDFPKDEKEIFSTVFGMTEKLYWRLEERFGKREEVEEYMVRFDEEPLWDQPDDQRQALEESAYFMICNDIIERVDSYLFCKGKPQGAWIYSPGQMRHVVLSYESDEDLKKATPEEKALFKDFVKKLYVLGDVTAIRILAWSHYKGNACYRQNWKKAEKYLLELYNRTSDPAAANGLGYIYYHGRTNENIGEYEKAFSYFAYAALDGIDESIYMVADMLIHGTGVKKNIDMGVEMLVTGYRETQDDFCRGIYDSRFAEYAYRMGEACQEGLLYGLG
ncbi:MAG: sel1 repeat family protein, partial [Lachnospiraceae bacterium]|nr:sel1 repeat family protein [Lachnospiraceae bacterium]